MTGAHCIPKLKAQVVMQFNVNQASETLKT